MHVISSGQSAAEGHTFIELSRDTMQGQVKKFGSARGLSPDGIAELQTLERWLALAKRCDYAILDLVRTGMTQRTQSYPDAAYSAIGLDQRNPDV